MLKTYRKDNEMGEEHVRMLHDFVKEATPEGNESGKPLQQLMAQMQNLMKYMGQMEQGLSMMGTEISVSRAQINMLMRILVEKDIMTEEEINEKYEKEVAIPIKKQFEEMKKKMEEQEKQNG